MNTGSVTAVATAPQERAVDAVGTGRPEGPRDSVDLGKDLVHAMLADQALLELGVELAQQIDPLFADPQQRTMFRMAGLYHREAGGLLPRRAVSEICERWRKPPGVALQYQSYFDLLTRWSGRVQDGAGFRWAAEQLRLETARHRLGQLLSQSMEILRDGASIQDERGQWRKLRGPDDAHAYLSTALEQLAGQQAMTEYQPVEWASALAGVREEPDWLCEPFLVRGRATVLGGPKETFKSLLALELSAALSAGIPVLGNPRREPVTVVYVDDENGADEQAARVKAMGHNQHGVARLKMFCFQGLPPLDTPKGGQALAGLARSCGAELVVLDTLHKMVAGKENEADTFLQFYNCSVKPLRAAGIAVLVIDHLGKDAEKGLRGSSAKGQMVELEWIATRQDSDSVSLRCDKDRGNVIRHRDRPVVIRWAKTSEVLHGVTERPVTAAEQAADELDSAGAPLDLGYHSAAKLLRNRGFKAGNETVKEALRIRRERPQPDPDDIFNGFGLLRPGDEPTPC